MMSTLGSEHKLSREAWAFAMPCASAYAAPLAGSRAQTAVTEAPGTSCKDLIQSEAMGLAVTTPQRRGKLTSSSLVKPRRMSSGVVGGNL